jgi:regulator of sirC expression with transglutaminase-like and TPR domain
MLNEAEIDALIKLLDDEDPEIYKTVSSKLISMGTDVLPKLESAWEETYNAFNPLLHERLEDLVYQINFNILFGDLNEWILEDNHDLLKGAILVAKFHFPDLNEADVYLQIDKIKQKIWIELNNHLTPLEKVNVFNTVFYNSIGFGGSYASKPEIKDYCVNAVLDSKDGNTISLGIIYLVIAQQLSLPVYGVKLYRHFVVSYQKKFIEDFQSDHSMETVFYINPMNKGMIFQRADIKEYLQKMQQPITAIQNFTPTDNKGVIEELLKYILYYFKEKEAYEKIEQIERLLDLFE